MADDEALESLDVTLSGPDGQDWAVRDVYAVVSAAVAYRAAERGWDAKAREQARLELDRALAKLEL